MTAWMSGAFARFARRLRAGDVLSDTDVQTVQRMAVLMGELERALHSALSGQVPVVAVSPDDAEPKP